MIQLHANFVEWTFCAISTLLVGCSGFALREAILDSAFLTANRVNGPRSLIADQNIREESIKMTIGGVMLLTSIVSLFLEPPPPPYTLVPQSIVSMVAWCLVAALMVVSSATSRSVRRRLLRYSPVEVAKVVETLPAVEGGRTKEEVIDEAASARNDSFVRRGERQGDVAAEKRKRSGTER